MKKKSKKAPFYSEVFKKEVVKDIVYSKLSTMEACIKHQVGSERSIYRWKKRYQKFVEDEKKLTLLFMKEKIKPDSDLSKEELLELKFQLERELKQALLEAEANKILVDIAKEEFNLDLRKKHGAKQ